MTLTRHGIKRVHCPECGARPGDDCVYRERPKRYKQGQSHYARMRAAQAIYEGERPIHGRPTVTLVSDASWADTDRRAGWAGVIVGEGREPLRGSGKAVYHKNGSLIELEAIGQTLRMAHDALFFEEPDTHMVIQSDSLGALCALATLQNAYHRTRTSDNTINPITDWGRLQQYLPYISRIGELTHMFDMVYLKHVKGHTGKQDGRYKMNAWCDSEAKRVAWGTRNGD